MDVRIDDTWCTLKEFCRITSWQLSENRLRQIIKKDCFPYPAVKVRYSFKKILYMIQLTDPVQRAALKRLRELRCRHESAHKQAEKVFGTNSLPKEKPAPSKWKTIRVNIRGYDYVFIQSGEFLRSLYDYIVQTGKTITIEKEKLGSIFISLPRDVYGELSNIAKRSSCSIGDALHGLILEFMKTPQGKAAAIFTTRLQPSGPESGKTTREGGSIV